MLLCWCVLMLWLFANAENVGMCREPGGDVTLECSASRCPESISGSAGMYLYRFFRAKEEVLYYRNGPNRLPTEMDKYINRTKVTGNIDQHNITLKNLTVKDSGIYSCVYKWFNRSHKSIQCNTYLVLVEGSAQHMPPTQPHNEPQDHQLEVLAWVIIALCIIIVLLTTAVIGLLIWQKVKPLARLRRRRTSETSNTYVYEVMTRGQSRPPASQQY